MAVSKLFNIDFSTSIDKIISVNESFDSGVLKVAYHGKNRNGSEISKDAFERSIKTMYYCPVVANYIESEDDFGGHDEKIVTDDKGNNRLVNLTEPVGLIPYGANYWWDTVTDSGGTHEYLFVDVLLWKRQRGYKKIIESGIVKHSMEIKVNEYDEGSDGCLVINDFTFLAFCLLSDNIEPCFEASSLEVFEKADGFQEKYSEMFEDFKREFTKNQPLTEDEINHLEKEERKAVNEKNELLSSYGFTLEKIDCDIEAITIEELKGKIFELIGNIYEELSEKVRAEQVETEWGSYNKFYMVDYDLDAKEVYCLDSEDWKLYGIPFGFNGDSITVDFESKKRKKYSIVDYVEGTEDVSFSVISKIVNDAVSIKSAEFNKQAQDEKIILENNISEMNNSFAQVTHELEELKIFKSETEAKALAAKKEEIIQKWSFLGEAVEFVELKGKINDFSVEELEKQCKCVYADLNANFTMKPEQSRRIPIEAPVETLDAYGGILTKHGKTPVKNN